MLKSLYGCKIDIGMVNLRAMYLGDWVSQGMCKRVGLKCLSAGHDTDTRVRVCTIQSSFSGRVQWNLVANRTQGGYTAR